jgi:hypothetical protein
LLSHSVVNSLYQCQHILNEEQEKMPGIKTMTVEVFDGASALSKLGAVATKREVKAALAHALVQGFTPSTKASDVQGFKRSYKPEGIVTKGGETVSKLDYTYLIQDLKRAGSSDRAAILVGTLTAPGIAGGSEVDVRYLFAPNGDVAKAVEKRYDATTKDMVDTNSWWTRFKACIKGKCAKTCAASLGTCTFTGWAGYLQCVAIACGGCSAKCVVCAGCKCRWWCKWAVGCCED